MILGSAVILVALVIALISFAILGVKSADRHFSVQRHRREVIGNADWRLHEVASDILRLMLEEARRANRR